uniref:Uncharacterized protein n=1 Tax=Branchiostoma floridae TaxID=7739 RepID=C3ZUN6_BRAFL|eukprot:XP_002587737.1 hypothetical protein BRAFLDRAFT_94640 [Branchiostoma floridae]
MMPPHFLAFSRLIGQATALSQNADLHDAEHQEHLSTLSLEDKIEKGDFALPYQLLDETPKTWKGLKGDNPHISNNEGDTPHIPDNEGDTPHISNNEGDTPHISNNEGDTPHISNNEGDTQHIPDNEGDTERAYDCFTNFKGSVRSAKLNASMRSLFPGNKTLKGRVPETVLLTAFNIFNPEAEDDHQHRLETSRSSRSSYILAHWAGTDGHNYNLDAQLYQIRLFALDVADVVNSNSSADAKISHIKAGDVNGASRGVREVISHYLRLPANSHLIAGDDPVISFRYSLDRRPQNKNTTIGTIMACITQVRSHEQ